MWTKIVLALFGLGGGFAVAGGLFALIIAVGLVAEFADRTHTARYVLFYEGAVAAGGILGNCLSVYQPTLLFGEAGVGVYGIFTGIFVGAWAMALTEIVNAIPIFTRRLELRKGLSLIVISMAIGRSVGAFLYFVWRF